MILWLGPDDLIDLPADSLLERVAFVHRWPVVVRIPFLLHLEPALSHVPVGTARLVELGCVQDTFAGLIQREKQLERYSRIEAGLPWSPACPARSIAGIGWLFDLLPRASRSRPVDPSGVVELHRCLAVLDAGAES